MAEIAAPTRAYRGAYHTFRLSEKDRLCLVCPVKGGCNETSPKCLRKLHKAARVYVALLEGEKTIRQVANAVGQTQKVAARWLDALCECGLVTCSGKGSNKKWRAVQ